MFSAEMSQYQLNAPPNGVLLTSINKKKKKRDLRRIRIARRFVEGFTTSAPGTYPIFLQAPYTTFEQVNCATSIDKKDWKRVKIWPITSRDASDVKKWYNPPEFICTS